MSWKPFTTFEDFLETRQDFDQILTIHVSYASSYLALLQCYLIEHLIVDIWEDLDILRFLPHWEYPPQVTSSHWDRIQQQSKRYSWKDNHLFLCLPQGDRMVPSHMNDLVLFRRHIRSLDTLELKVFIAFSLLITIGEVCMLKSETSLLGVNNVIQWKLPSPFDISPFSTPYSGHVMWFSWRVTIDLHG
jgi:hypothetical protein